MDSAATVEHFETALEEEGITDAKVNHYTRNDGFSEVIAAKKVVDGEPLVVRNSLSLRELEEIDNVQKHVAMLARQTARKFEDNLTEMHEWGDNAIQLDLSEDYTATCLRCGAEASLDDLERTAVRSAETAIPQPNTGSYESLPTEKIRMTLLALLKGECDALCPNSPLDKRDVRYNQKI